MTNHSNHTDYEISSKGIIMVSKLRTDIPFIIQCNQTFGIVIRLGEDTINLTYDIDWQLLDLKRMVLYHGDIDNHSTWILVIPTFGNELNPCDYFKISQLSTHKMFSEKDFPDDFQIHKNIAVITGFPE